MRCGWMCTHFLVKLKKFSFASVDADGFCRTDTSSLCLPQVQSVLQDQGEAVPELCDVQQRHRARKVLLSLRPHGDLQRRRLQMVRAARSSLSARPIVSCQILTLVLLLDRQHMRNCTLTGSQLFQDILSYSLPLIGCSESSSDEDIGAATGLTEHLLSAWMFFYEAVYLEPKLHVCVCCRKIHEEAVWPKQRPDGRRPEGRPPRQQSERKQAAR